MDWKVKKKISSLPLSLPLSLFFSLIFISIPTIERLGSTAVMGKYQVV